MKGKKPLKAFVGKFVPFSGLSPIEGKGVFGYLGEWLQRTPLYSPKGRWAITRVLCSRNIKRVLLPSYICRSVIEGVSAAGSLFSFYDLDPRDLNADVYSIKKEISRWSPDCVLVASMYGNPADLPTIEEVCIENDVLLLDDAAQAFGAYVENRKIGTFGNMGFMSFSPGKPVSSHVGAFYWANDKWNFPHINGRRHFLLHWLQHWHYLRTRVRVYERIPSYIDNILGKALSFYFSRFPQANDALLGFEERFLCSQLLKELTISGEIRRKRFLEFIDSVEEQKFRIIKPLRGLPNPHKIVLVFQSTHLRDKMIQMLSEHGVYSQPGYTPVFPATRQAPACAELYNKLLELPVDEDEGRFGFLIDVVRSCSNEL